MQGRSSACKTNIASIQSTSIIIKNTFRKSPNANYCRNVRNRKKKTRRQRTVISLKIQNWALGMNLWKLSIMKIMVLDLSKDIGLVLSCIHPAASGVCSPDALRLRKTYDSPYTIFIIQLYYFCIQIQQLVAYIYYSCYNIGS